MDFYYYVLNFAHVKLLCHALYNINSYLRLRHINLIRFVFILLIITKKMKAFFSCCFFYLIRNKHDEVPLSDEGITFIAL